MSEPKAVTLTPDQLKDLLVSMAQELRKPADPTPEQLAQKQNDLEARKGIAQMQLEGIEAKKRLQAACAHTRAFNGSSTCVYIYPQSDGKSGNYVICQQCQAIIHPGVRPEGPLGKDLENHIFDTQLFNIHYQKAMSSPTNF